MDFSFLLAPAMIWFLVGLALVLAEFAIPGVVVVFFGVGAWLVALLSLVVEMTVLLQIIIFLVISISSLIILRRYFMPARKEGQPADDASDFIGKVAVSQEEITTHGLGKVMFNGTLWRAKPEQETIPEGTHVEIVGQENLILIVNPLEREKEE